MVNPKNWYNSPVKVEEIPNSILNRDMFERCSSSLSENWLESELLIFKEFDLKGVRVGGIMGWLGQIGEGVGDL